MNKVSAICLAMAVMALPGPGLAQADGVVAIRGGKIMTVTGGDIEKGTIVVIKGKISGLGPVLQGEMRSRTWSSTTAILSSTPPRFRR